MGDRSGPWSQLSGMPQGEQPRTSACPGRACLYGAGDAHPRFVCGRLQAGSSKPVDLHPTTAEPPSPLLRRSRLRAVVWFGASAGGDPPKSDDRPAAAWSGAGARRWAGVMHAPRSSSVAAVHRRSADARPRRRRARPRKQQDWAARDEPSRAAQQRPSRYTGMMPCLRRGRSTVRFQVSSRPSASSRRVSRGSMTSST